MRIFFFLLSYLIEGLTLREEEAKKDTMEKKKKKEA